MIAIISDLHLQHTVLDSLRYRAKGKLYETGVRRNIGKEAFDRYFERIQEIAERRKSEEIHLVFAGDIFELHRTPLWFLGTPVRPTQAAGADDPGNPLRERTMQIMDAIQDEHRDIWDVIKKFVNGPQAQEIRIQAHYVPGNHDRLANAWPSLRQRICDLLCLSQYDPQQWFPNRLDFLAEYNTIIRHGQEYDAYNFVHSTKKKAALDKTSAEYLEPAFGDYVTVDIAARLALAFRTYYEVALRKQLPAPGPQLSPEDMRGLYLKLTEFDDVRPTSLLLEYLANQMKASHANIFELLRPILRDSVESAVSDPFFDKIAGRYVPKTLLKVLPTLLKQLSASAIEDTVRLLTSKAREESPSPAALAQPELNNCPGASVIVAGHTHEPEQVPILPAQDSQSSFYLNSGTWRTVIPFGVNTFGRLRAYTMIFCFNEKEAMAGKADGRRFETWTGHLSAETLGPYDEEVIPKPDEPQPARQLLFKRLEIRDVESEWNGAEIRCQFGVDDVAREGELTKVEQGAAISLNCTPILLDPALDGHIWFHGVEVDGGETGIDPNDLLPWAFAPLPRDTTVPKNRYGQFSVGDYSLRIVGLNDTDFVLHYSIV